jgi:serine/threonine-protein phosphatase 5
MGSWQSLKAEGNEYFRLQQYQDACRCYTSAIQKCPLTNTNEVSNLYDILSATQLILKRVPEAIQSATQAIEFDRSNYKGYVRRAAAYSESMAFQEAFDDFQVAAKLQPNEAYLRDQLERARRRLIESGRYVEPVQPEPQPVTIRASASSPLPTRPSTPHQTTYTVLHTTQTVVELMSDRRPPAFEFRDIVRRTTEMHQKMPNIVSITVTGRIHIVGDMHGQYQDLVAIFHRLGFPSANNPYLFNGDLVDRGSMGVEILIAILQWKLTDPASVYINRGNQFLAAGFLVRSAFEVANTQ